MSHSKRAAPVARPLTPCTWALSTANSALLHPSTAGALHAAQQARRTCGEAADALHRRAEHGRRCLAVPWPQPPPRLQQAVAGAQVHVQRRVAAAAGRARARGAPRPQVAGHAWRQARLRQQQAQVLRPSPPCDDGPPEVADPHGARHACALRAPVAWVPASMPAMRMQPR